MGAPLQPTIRPAPSGAAASPREGPASPGEPAQAEAVLGVVLAVLLAGAAATLLGKARFGWGGPVRAPGVGPVSEVTLALTGVALLVTGYHAFVYAMGIEGYRAPMWVVVTIGAGVVLGSLALDALENRAVERTEQGE